MVRLHRGHACDAVRRAGATAPGPRTAPERRRSKSFRQRWLGARDRVRSIERTAKFSGGRPSRGANGVGPGLLQEARAKAARRTVQSERPGHTAGAFAFCGVRTAFCDKGLRARRSLGVGQRSGVAGCLADPRRGLAGLSLRASRDRAPQKVSGSRFPRPKCTNS